MIRPRPVLVPPSPLRPRQHLVGRCHSVPHHLEQEFPDLRHTQRDQSHAPFFAARASPPATEGPPLPPEQTDSASRAGANRPTTAPRIRPGRNPLCPVQSTPRSLSTSQRSAPTPTVSFPADR